MPNPVNPVETKVPKEEFISPEQQKNNEFFDAEREAIGALSLLSGSVEWGNLFKNEKKEGEIAWWDFEAVLKFFDTDKIVNADLSEKNIAPGEYFVSSFLTGTIKDQVTGKELKVPRSILFLGGSKLVEYLNKTIESQRIAIREKYYKNQILSPPYRTTWAKDPFEIWYGNSLHMKLEGPEYGAWNSGYDYPDIPNLPIKYMSPKEKEQFLRKINDWWRQEGSIMNQGKNIPKTFLSENGEPISLPPYAQQEFILGLLPYPDLFIKIPSRQELNEPPTTEEEKIIRERRGSIATLILQSPEKNTKSLVSFGPNFLTIFDFSKLKISPDSYQGEKNIPYHHTEIQKAFYFLKAQISF